MYKIVMLDNYLDSQKLEINEKEYDSLEAAEDAYAELFKYVKNLILEALKLMMEADKTQALVLQQIIDVVSEIEMDEEIELNSRGEKFLLVEKNHIEFSLAGKHIVVKIV